MPDRGPLGPGASTMITSTINYVDGTVVQGSGTTGQYRPPGRVKTFQTIASQARLLLSLHDRSISQLETETTESGEVNY
jgi:hypothetical protein